MARKKTINSFEFWRYLTDFWSIVFFLLIFYNLFTGNTSLEILNTVSIVYVGALAIYVSNKEFERWYDKHERQHPGEIFVIIWSVLMVVLTITDFWYKESYQIPASVVSSYIAVLTILVITRRSKQAYQKRRLKK